jgi:hypothetical protein
MIKNHNDLLDSLAIAKSSIFKNCNLGSKYLNMVSYGKEKLPRADLIVFNPSYTNFQISVFEIKWSRSDFLQDLRSKKWESYLPHCHRFYFATPFLIPGDPGKRKFLNIKEIPAQAGLIQYNCEKKTWRVKKAPPKKEIEIDLEFLMAMIFYKQRGGDRQYWRNMTAKIGEIKHVYRHEMADFGRKVAEAVIFYNIYGNKK